MRLILFVLRNHSVNTAVGRIDVRVTSTLWMSINLPRAQLGWSRPAIKFSPLRHAEREITAINISAESIDLIDGLWLFSSPITPFAANSFIFENRSRYLVGFIRRARIFYTWCAGKFVRVESFDFFFPTVVINSALLILTL